MASSNPFTPAFGSEPLFLAGREKVMEDILGGLENGPGDPNRVSILIGPRGSGKTVLLSKIAMEAEGKGWLSANVTAAPGMLDGIIEQVQEKGEGFLPAKAKSRLTGVQLSGFGLSREVLPENKASWRVQVARILEILKEYDTGLLITVDEVRVDLDEMIELVSTFQHFVREKRETALIMAGLPGKVLQLFHNETISFLRRAFQHRLDAISLPDVKVALKRTIELSGRKIDKDALEKASAPRSQGSIAFVCSGRGSSRSMDAARCSLRCRC
jgi:molybdopterin-guanine dinucleotide biosynthesis protein